jgi:hypothetical protein
MKPFDPTECEDACREEYDAGVAKAEKEHEERLQSGRFSIIESERILESNLGWWDLFANGCIEDCRRKYYQSLAEAETEARN